MFDRFGEFDSHEEINEQAEKLLNNGDTGNIRVLARENGIEEDMVDLYLLGDVPVLCDALDAALGKIKVETQGLKLEGIFTDWAELLQFSCGEDEKLAEAVRKKGKNLAGCMGALLKYAFEHKIRVSEEICKAAGLRDGKRTDPVYMGIPGKQEVRMIIRRYYMG